MRTLEHVVVIPVFEDSASLSLLLDKLSETRIRGLFCVIVDDGSISCPPTHDLLSSKRLGGVVIELKKNVGHPTAIAIGLWFLAHNYLVNDTVFIMDSDGEDSPEHIELLKQRIEDGGVDIAVAQRKRRSEHLHFKFFYYTYRSLFFLLTGKSLSFGNFMALKPAVVPRILSNPVLALHIASSVLASNAVIRYVPVDRGKRFFGQSRMNFLSLVNHGFRSLGPFLDLVLLRTGLGTVVLGLTTIILMVLTLFAKFSGISIPGWTSVFLGILMLLLLQFSFILLLSLILFSTFRVMTLDKKMNYESFIRQVTPFGGVNSS